MVEHSVPNIHPCSSKRYVQLYSCALCTCLSSSRSVDHLPSIGQWDSLMLHIIPYTSRGKRQYLCSLDIKHHMRQSCLRLRSWLRTNLPQAVIPIRGAPVRQSSYAFDGWPHSIYTTTHNYQTESYLPLMFHYMVESVNGSFNQRCVWEP